MRGYSTNLTFKPQSRKRVIFKNHQRGESLTKSCDSGILFGWITFYLNTCSVSVPKNEIYGE
jgi:hypothetical protein